MRTLAFVALSLVAGCGGRREVAPAMDSGLRADAAVSDAGVDAAVSDAGIDAALPDGGNDDAATTFDAGPPSDAADARVALRDVAIYSNCMPVVAADPIVAFWTADVSGAMGSTATLVDATLTITGARTVVQSITVDMPVITLSGGAGSGMQRKTAADTNPGFVCGELCGGATVSLDLAYDTLGGRIAVRHEDAFGCVF